MYNSRLNMDSDSIDFDFFEGEGDRIKLYENVSKPNCNASKITTKAVIEANPIKLFDSKYNNDNSKTIQKNKENSISNENGDCLSSPSSSEEKRLLDNCILDNTLLNCLAYNDDNHERKMFLDDKYYSDNSLSDSTITTVTSDFTYISQLSSISDSSSASDLSADSPTPQNGDPITNDNSNENLNDQGINELIVCESHLNEPEEINVDKTGKQEAEVFDVGLLDNVTSVSQSHESDEESIEIKSPSDKDSNCNSDNTEYKDSIDERDSHIANNHTSPEPSQHDSLSRKESISTLEEGLGDISLASQSSTNSNTGKLHSYKGGNKFRSKKKELNLTFSREELIKIERDNLILLKKIMAYSKPRSVSLNHGFSHKKTSAAINRARQQKKIEQDNYILYSKISSMGRTKKVF